MANHSSVEIGQRFGRLVVVKATVERVNRHIFWECRCDCGKTTYASADNLRRGFVQSCGCLRVEVQRYRHRTGKTAPKL